MTVGLNYEINGIDWEAMKDRALPRATRGAAEVVTQNFLRERFPMRFRDGNEGPNVGMRLGPRRDSYESRKQRRKGHKIKLRYSGSLERRALATADTRISVSREANFTAVISFNMPTGDYLDGYEKWDGRRVSAGADRIKRYTQADVRRFEEMAASGGKNAAWASRRLAAARESVKKVDIRRELRQVTGPDAGYWATWFPHHLALRLRSDVRLHRKRSQIGAAAK